MRTRPDVHGILVVDKPPGPTSHDVVAQARRKYGTPRVGHTGTLDPMATGVLVLLFGEATKLSATFCSADKLYHARVVFGFSTDTDDATGKPVEVAPIGEAFPDNESLYSALKLECERTVQIPPRYSAIKVNGERLYHAARRGVEAARAARPVKVHNLRVVEIGQGYLDLEVLSSKGYYVRALARDLGVSLRCPAHLGSLRRIQSGAFGIDLCTQWPSPVTQPLMSLVDAARLAIPTFDLTDGGLQRARKGQALSRADFVNVPTPAGQTRHMAWTYENQLIALGHWCDEFTLRVARGFCFGP